MVLTVVCSCLSTACPHCVSTHSPCVSPSVWSGIPQAGNNYSVMLQLSVALWWSGTLYMYELLFSMLIKTAIENVNKIVLQQRHCHFKQYSVNVSFMGNFHQSIGDMESTGKYSTFIYIYICILYNSPSPSYYLLLSLDLCLTSFQAQQIPELSHCANCQLQSLLIININTTHDGKYVSLLYNSFLISVLQDGERKQGYGSEVHWWSDQIHCYSPWNGATFGIVR